jgi:hypothetical protein
MTQLGRISGPILTSNLERDPGEDLAFETDLLYLDVTNSRIGLNKNNPTTALNINGYVKTTDLIVDNQAIFDNLIFNANGTISTVVGPINISPAGAGAVINLDRVLTAQLEINGNVIKNYTTNGNVVLNPNASGSINIQSSTSILGNLAVTGNTILTGDLSAADNIIVGDSPLDVVTVAPDFTQDIIPGINNTYDLGKSAKRWSQLHVANVTSGGSLIFSGSNYLSLSAAQTIGTQAFTFECFFYTASNGLQTILGASAAGGMSIWLFGDGINPVTTIQIDRSYVDHAQYTVSPITINTWHHIAVTRDSSNNMSVFLDGVKATGSTSNAANYTGASGLIGAVWSSPYFFTGYLTQIKLVVGSNYYTPTEASIVIPTALLTTSTNTTLLLTAAASGTYLTDTSGVQTISNIGTVIYSTFSPLTAVANLVLPQAVVISDQMRLDGVTGQIISVQSNDDIRITPFTGITSIERTQWQDNTVTNLNNSAITFASTATGYLKYQGTNGFVIPAGTGDDAFAPGTPQNQRRASPEEGETRWNTDLAYIECYDGTVWQLSTGGGATISVPVMQDLGNVYTLILG